METMSNIITELEKVFDAVNSEFYGGVLAKPIITVQTGRRSVLGWCSTKERWSASGEKYYEINIVAENLGRTKEQIICTLMHECVHLYNAQNGVIDCGPTQYHNKHFRTVAEEHGLIVEKVKNRGFAKTDLNEAGKKFAESQTLNFDCSRINTERARKYEKPITYMCPECHKKIRFHNYKLNVICGECNKKYEPVS